MCHPFCKPSQCGWGSIQPWAPIPAKAVITSVWQEEVLAPVSDEETEFQKAYKRLVQAAQHSLGLAWCSLKSSVR